jgi:hypothetical protein
VSRLRLPPSFLIALVALVSFGLLLLRSRPLERFNAASEALLYASGLSAPRALYSLDDGTILAVEGTGPAARVVEIGVDGAKRPVSSAPPALTLPDVAAGESTLPFPRLGTAWSVARAPDGAALAALPLSNRVVRLEADGTQRILAESFTGTAGRNPLPVAVAVSPAGDLHVALFSTDAGRIASGQVVRLAAGGRREVAFDGLTLPIGLGFGPGGQLFVLELARGIDPRSGQAVPKTGRLLALGPAAHQRRTIARDLDLPGGLVFTPAGDAYLTERAFPPALEAGSALLLRLPSGELAPTSTG